MDPKPTARIVDPLAVPLDDLPLVHALCPLCGRRRNLTRHHVIPRGQGGDDVPENLVWVCGDGTRGCHGVLTHRNRDGETGLTFAQVGNRLIRHLRSFRGPRGGEYLDYIARTKYEGWLDDYYCLLPREAA